MFLALLWDNFFKQVRIVVWSIWNDHNPDPESLKKSGDAYSVPSHLPLAWTIEVMESSSACYSVIAVTVCPGSSDPPEKIFNIFASENEVYTIY